MLFINDKIRYKITINGIAVNPKTNKKIVDIKISDILSRLTLEFRPSFLLNFNDIKGAFITSKKGIIIAISEINLISVNMGKRLKLICGIDAIKIARAGVGNPIKSVDCLSVTLNFAKR